MNPRQGSSFKFEIASNADLTDGLQISDLVDGLVLNAREVDTGRYHPPLLELNADGTGSMQNSNNFGGINPFNNQFVDIDFGEEYIIELSFDPTSLTIATPLIGDLNCDGNVNLLDVGPFVDLLGNGGTNLLADTNGDGQVNLLDVNGFVAILGGG